MSEPIRILQVVTQMVRGGIECRLMDIYRNIDRTRVQFDFLTFRQEPGFFDEEIASLGGRIYYSGPIAARTYLSIPKRVESLLKQHPEYKTVHAHMNQWCGIILKGAMMAGVPVRIAHSHNAFDKGTLKNLVKNIVKKSTNRYATHRFAVSQKAGIWLFGRKMMESGQVTVYPNSIDCCKYRYNPEIRENMRRKLNLGDAYTLIFIANLRRQKNPMFLIDVFDRLYEQCKESKLLIVGADDMDGQVQAYAAAGKSASNIAFLGARSDVHELLQAGDVFVFPSLYEGFGTVAVEAQAVGLPCVISDTIPGEVCLTEHIIQLPINKGVDIWVKQILKYKDTPRIDTYKQICEKGYDIYRLCDTMTEFYESAAAEESH